MGRVAVWRSGGEAWSSARFTHELVKLPVKDLTTDSARAAKADLANRPDPARPGQTRRPRSWRAQGLPNRESSERLTGRRPAVDSNATGFLVKQGSNACPKYRSNTTGQMLVRLGGTGLK